MQFQCQAKFESFLAFISLKYYGLWSASLFGAHPNLVISRSAESAYRRMIDAVRLMPMLLLASDSYTNKNIRRIDYIVNETLSRAFYHEKEMLLRSGFPADECYMFHGTNGNNIDLILQNNFDPKYNPTHKVKGLAYGDGVYFSEYPSVGLSYGTLILCRVLPGRVQVTNLEQSDLEGHHFKRPTVEKWFKSS